MNVLETITVRLHDLKSVPLIKAALMHMSSAVTIAPIRIDLFQNAAVHNDWLIQILRPAGRITADKSPFAVSLAESFRPIGMVHHSVLVPKPLPAERLKNHPKQHSAANGNGTPHFSKTNSDNILNGPEAIFDKQEERK
jgi:hypothetical protein